MIVDIKLDDGIKEFKYEQKGQMMKIMAVGLKNHFSEKTPFKVIFLYIEFLRKITLSNLKLFSNYNLQST